jgi:hypothetical protein
VPKAKGPIITSKESFKSPAKSPKKAVVVKEVDVTVAIVLPVLTDHLRITCDPSLDLRAC